MLAMLPWFCLIRTGIVLVCYVNSVYVCNVANNFHYLDSGTNRLYQNIPEIKSHPLELGILNPSRAFLSKYSLTCGSLSITVSKTRLLELDFVAGMFGYISSC